MMLSLPTEETNKKLARDDLEDITVDSQDEEVPKKVVKSDRAKKMKNIATTSRRNRRALFVFALLVLVAMAVVLALLFTSKDSDEKESTGLTSNADPCDPNPCQEGAPLCVETNVTIRCMAACEATPDACEEEHEFCLDIDGGMSLECQHPCDEDWNPCDVDELCGLKRTGDIKCTDPNPCDPNPCTGIGVCIDEGEGRFKCDH